MKQMKIPPDELTQLEVKCNALLAIEQDYEPLLRSVEDHYRTKTIKHVVRRVVGGGAARPELLLKEEQLSA